MTDDKQVQALAGIGANASKVEVDTTEVILAAHFDMDLVRQLQTASITTDSSIALQDMSMQTCRQWQFKWLI